MDGIANNSTPSTMRVRGIVLDLEHVLIELRPWEQWLATQLQEVFAGPMEPWVQRWYRSELRRCANMGLIPLRHAWYDYLRTIGVSPGWAEELVIGLRCRYDESLRDCRTSFHADSALRALQQLGFEFAVLADCSWSESQLNSVIQRLRLPVELRYTATTAMIGKQHTVKGVGREGEGNVYTHLLHTLAWTGDRTVYVGWNDRPLAAARQAGLTTVRLNGCADAPADHVVTDLRELPRLLTLPSSTAAERRAA